MAALNEAIRVTKPGGIIMTAFLSVHAIMYTNYLQGNWHAGMEENFAEAYRVKHFEEQLFTGFDIGEFESLFENTHTRKIATVATDGILELAEGREDFSMSDDEFASYAAYHLHHCEKRELLGSSNHLLYICEKQAHRA